MLSVIFFAMSAHRNQSRFECRLKGKQYIFCNLVGFLHADTAKKMIFKLASEFTVMFSVHVSNFIDTGAVTFKKILR